MSECIVCLGETDGLFGVNASSVRDECIICCLCLLYTSEVLREGMEKGVFQIDDLDMTAEIVHYSVKGIETPYIRGHIGANLDDSVRDTYVTRLVLGALGKK